MKLTKKWCLDWVWPKHEWFAWSVFRFNGGGYMFGTAPYTYWRVGPIFVKRYT